MLGFKSMETDYATIKGIEVMRALRKGQAPAFYYSAPLGEMCLVSIVFAMLDTVTRKKVYRVSALQQCRQGGAATLSSPWCVKLLFLSQQRHKHT
jgi:hypothetical protein